MAQPDPVAHAQLAWQSVHAEFGATHAATLAALLALAAARRDAGDTTGALRDANQVLAARREQLGAEHPDTLATAALLANWRLHAGDSTAADTLHELLPVLTRVLGAEHPDTLHAHHTLAAAQDAGDDPADRLVRWVQLTGAETRVFGVRHELTLAAAYAAAFARHELGDTFGASQDALVVESYRRNLLGEHHPDTLAARLARLTWYGEATGVTDEILSRFDDLIPVLQNVLGHDHPDTVLARYTRTAWTPPTHDEVETTSEWEILADDVARVHGNQHPLTVAARDKLAAAQADWQDSLDMCRELAADLWSDFIAEDRAGDPQSVRGSEVDDDLERVRDKADAEHAALIDLMATVVAVKKALADSARTAGNDALPTLLWRYYLAYQLWDAHRFEPAGPRTRRLVDDCARVLGEEHTLTTAAQELLSRIDERTWRHCSLYWDGSSELEPYLHSAR